MSIIGGAGYGAGEILRHLLLRDDVEIQKISSKDHIGEPLWQVHRNLRGFRNRGADRVLEDLPVQEAIAGADYVFLAMPHKVTAHVIKDALDGPQRIIDLSGDFRLRDLSDYQRDYAPEHPAPERLGTFVYGLPELNRAQIREAKHVASPGCFATTITLGLLPLAQAGMLAGARVRTVAMTGSSGSGVRPSAGTHHPVRHNNLKAYKILHHQHRPEIVQTLTDAGARDLALDFVPVSAPLARGILAVSQLDLPDGQSGKTLQGLYEKTYADSPLIDVLPLGASPEVNAVAGTARVEVAIQVREDAATGQKTLCALSALDNLIKGGAGQAIQSFNLMLGGAEDRGLEMPGLWP